MIRQEIKFYFSNEFGLQRQFTVPTHKSVGFLDQVITSEEVEVSKPLVNFFTSSDHGVVHFVFLQKHENLAIMTASCKNWQNFGLGAFADYIVAPIDRDIPENVWNSVLMNEVNYVNKNHPLKTKYVRVHTCPFLSMG